MAIAILPRSEKEWDEIIQQALQDFKRGKGNLQISDPIKPKTDEEWEAVARENKHDAEVSALLRLLDLERAKVAELQPKVFESPFIYNGSISTEKTTKEHDWTAFSHDPSPPKLFNE